MIVNDASRYYGEPNPPFSATITGFVFGQDASVLSGLTLSTVAKQFSPVGNYPITSSGGTAANYVIIRRIDGTLTINARAGWTDPTTIPALRIERGMGTCYNYAVNTCNKSGCACNDCSGCSKNDACDCDTCPDGTDPQHHACPCDESTLHLNYGNHLCNCHACACKESRERHGCGCFYRTVGPFCGHCSESGVEGLSISGLLCAVAGDLIECHNRTVK